MSLMVRWDPFARQGMERVCYRMVRNLPAIYYPNGDPATRGEATYTDGGFTYSGSCEWCGSTPIRLYQYGEDVFAPGTRQGTRNLGGSPRLFCNLGCRDAYHT